VKSGIKVGEEEEEEEEALLNQTLPTLKKKTQKREVELVKWVRMSNQRA
jgi:hypothetical protein